MFGVLYSFKVKPGQDEAFKEAWRKITEFIYQYENSLGPTPSGDRALEGANARVLRGNQNPARIGSA